MTGKTEPWLAIDWINESLVTVKFTDEDGCCRVNRTSPRERLAVEGRDREVATIDCLFDLVRRAVSAPPGWRGSGRPRRSCVGEVFSVGSTHAARLCKQFGFDPDEVDRQRRSRGGRR